MKFQFIYIVLACFFTAGISYNFQQGPTAKPAAGDVTGSPLSNNGATCGMCHFSMAFSPELEIKLLEGGTQIDKYEPGKTYQLELTTTTMGSPGGFGFQAVALDAGNASQGTFENLPMDVQVTELNGVNYLEQSKRLDANILTVDWTAPDVGSGELTIYAATVATDGDNTNGNDGAAKSSLTLSEAGGTNTTGIDDFKLKIGLLNNPVNDVLPIRIESSKGVSLKANLINLNGNRVMEQDLQIMQGDQVVTMEVGNLEKGIYFLQLTDGQSVKTEKVLKL